MIIIESKHFDVIVKSDFDYKRNVIYTVIYGLQVPKFSSLDNALSEFDNCVGHSATCEGEL